jgi:hypothetical protein
MSHAAVLILALLAALLQVGVIAVLESEVLAVPLLPVALLAGWCAVRSPVETWPIVLLTPLIVSPLSEERLGWFLVALLPAAVLGTLLSPIEERGAPPSVAHRLAVAAIVGAAGTLAHAALLATVAGVPERLAQDLAPIAGAAAWTALFAAAIAVALLPLRPRPRGLFA